MGNRNNKHWNKNNKSEQKIDNFEPKGRKEDLDLSIDSLGLSKSTLEALKKGGVSCVRDIAKRTMPQMYKIQNIGKKQCFEILGKIKRYNISYREEEAAQQVKNNNQTQNQKVQQSQQKVIPQGNNKVNNFAKDSSKTQNREQIFNNNQQIKGISFDIFDDSKLAEFLHGEKKRPEQVDQNEPIKKPDLIKFCRKGKWGYKDHKGNVVISPLFDEAFYFSEDMACVEKDGKLGFINKKGDLVIDYKYDVATSFSEGLAAVTINDKTGYIDKQDNIVFDMKYDIATQFEDGKAMINQNGQWGVLSKDGSVYWC